MPSEQLAVSITCMSLMLLFHPLVTVTVSVQDPLRTQVADGGIHILNERGE